MEDTEPPNGAIQGDTDPGKYAHQRKYRIEDSRDPQSEPLGSDTNLSKHTPKEYGACAVDFRLRV